MKQEVIGQYQIRDQLCEEWISTRFPAVTEPLIKKALRTTFEAGWEARKQAVDYALNREGN